MLSRGSEHVTGLEFVAGRTARVLGAVCCLAAPQTPSAAAPSRAEQTPSARREGLGALPSRSTPSRAPLPPHPDMAPMERLRSLR